MSELREYQKQVIDALGTARCVEMICEHEEIDVQAETYLKLRPFIRLVRGRLIWDPLTDVALAPTFEQWMEITDDTPGPGPVGLGFPQYIQQYRARTGAR